ELLHLPIQLLEMLGQAIDQVPERHGEFIAGILEDLGHSLAHVVDALGNDKSKFSEQPADLIGLRGTGLHKTLAHPMHRQDCLLFDVLDRHEAHSGPAHRLADRLRIGDVVFIRLHIRLHKLWCNKPYRMSKALQRTSPMMRTGASLHTNYAGRQVPKEYCHLCAPQLLAEHRLTPFIDPMHLKYVLRQIYPDRCNLHGGRSHSFKWLLDTSTLAR